MKELSTNYFEYINYSNRRKNTYLIIELFDLID